MGFTPVVSGGCFRVDADSHVVVLASFWDNTAQRRDVSRQVLTARAVARDEVDPLARA